MIISLTRVTAIITCQKHSFFLLLTAIELIEQSEKGGEVETKELGSFVKILKNSLPIRKQILKREYKKRRRLFAKLVFEAVSLQNGIFI